MRAVLRRMRKPVAAILVAAGLTGLATADLLQPTLFIVAPSTIIGGNPIIGTVVGMEDLTTVNASTTQPSPEGPPTIVPVGSCQGYPPILYFCFPTTEAMAMSIVTVKAQDTDESAIQPVLVR